MKKKSYTLVLGVNISAITYSDTLKQIEHWIKHKTSRYVCVAAVHLVMECQENPNLLKGVNLSGLVTPDGMPLVWLSHFYGHKEVERVYGPTLMLKLCELARKRKYKIFLLGGSLGQSTVLKEKLVKQFSGLKIVGNIDTSTQPIPDKNNHEIIIKINKSGANIVFVGMGCPVKELWMIDNRKYLKPQVLIGVGAAFDFISGYKKQAPVWIQNFGLEWLFRLIQEPSRLCYRYLVMNIGFILLIVRRLMCDFVFFHADIK